eukprot:9045560-Alexandrium_andersonii.AAC.1
MRSRSSSNPASRGGVLKAEQLADSGRPRRPSPAGGLGPWPCLGCPAGRRHLGRPHAWIAHAAN